LTLVQYNKAFDLPTSCYLMALIPDFWCQELHLQVQDGRNQPKFSHVQVQESALKFHHCLGHCRRLCAAFGQYCLPLLMECLYLLAFPDVCCLAHPQSVQCLPLRRSFSVMCGTSLPDRCSLCTRLLSLAKLLYEPLRLHVRLPERLCDDLLEQLG